MHFPEEQLATYLRAFLPQDRIDGVLDEVAMAALDEEVEDHVGLFVLAHRLMGDDRRRTADLEAVVLVEEVGLPAAEVARVLDLTPDEVEAAVMTAWQDVPVEDGPTWSVAGQADGVPRRPRVAPPDAPVDAGDGPVGAGRAGGRPAHPVRRWGPLAVGVVALVALGVAVFSEAGMARLHAAGLDPLAAFLVVVVLVGGGMALVRAGGSPRPPRGAGSPAEEEGGPEPPDAVADPTAAQGGTGGSP